jgi:hypothetical protein
MAVLLWSSAILAGNGPATPAGDSSSRIAVEDPDQDDPTTAPNQNEEPPKQAATPQEPPKEEKVREGRHFAGLPIVNFNSDDGFGYGAKGAFYDYGQNEKPYRNQLAIQIFLTTRHVQDHELYWDIPRVRDGAWRFELKAKYQQVLFSNWFGPGNEVFDDSVFGAVGNPADFSQDDLDKVADYYHSYQETEPELIVHLRHGEGRTKLFLGIQGKSVEVDPHTPADIDDFEDITVDPGWQSFLEQTKPYGFGGGDVGTMQVGLVYDTRDQEASPGHGSFVDVSARGMYFDADDSAETVGTSPWYEGANVSARHYFTLGRPLVLATRFVADFLDGDVPFFDLNSFGGLEDYTGLGGGDSLRGVRSSTFQGKIKAVVTPELRYTPFDIGTNLRLGFVLFADVGRVWQEYESEGGGVHTGVGAGVRAIWSENFIVRLDAAKAESDDVRVYLDFGQVF